MAELKDKEKKMELFFTGAGAAYYPELGSNCAFFVQKDHLYMFDCGENTFRRMKERKEIFQCEKITVYITHLHADHIGSLGSMVSYCSNVLKKKVQIMAQEETIIQILSMMGIRSEMYEFAANYETEDDTLKITPIEVSHVRDMKCCGYLIENGEEKIYYSGDCCEIPEDILQEFLKGEIHTMYQDCTYVNEISTSHHSLNRLVELIPPEMRKRFYCMHFGSDMTEKVKKYGFCIPRIV